MDEHGGRCKAKILGQIVIFPWFQSVFRESLIFVAEIPQKKSSKIPRVGGWNPHENLPFLGWSQWSLSGPRQRQAASSAARSPPRLRPARQGWARPSHRPGRNEGSRSLRSQGVKGNALGVGWKLMLIDEKLKLELISNLPTWFWLKLQLWVGWLRRL